MNVIMPYHGAAIRSGSWDGGQHADRSRELRRANGADTRATRGDGLPDARSVLAVVGRPGDEATYLGALLDAFRAGGTEVSALALTTGEVAPGQGGSESRSPTVNHSSEFEVSALVLRVTHRLMADYPDGGLAAIPAHERVRGIVGMIRRCSADLLLTADSAGVDPLVLETTCAAGRAEGVPVLAWTLPAGVADEVRAAGGLGVPDHPLWRADLMLKVSRRAQRRAMRAHRSLGDASPAHLVRLDVQGDREWLRWLVLPASPAGGREG
ncbi:MAG TPA: PIG-L family deacetylase [Streptosporangiaceae bacterium]